MKKEILAFDDADTNTMSNFFFNLGAGIASPYATHRCAECGEEMWDDSDYCETCLADMNDR